MNKKQEKENEQRLSLTHKKHDSVIVITKDNNRIKGSITFRVFMQIPFFSVSTKYNQRLIQNLISKYKTFETTGYIFFKKGLE